MAQQIAQMDGSSQTLGLPAPKETTKVSASQLLEIVGGNSVIESELQQQQDNTITPSTVIIPEDTTENNDGKKDNRIPQERFNEVYGEKKKLEEEITKLKSQYDWAQRLEEGLKNNPKETLHQFYNGLKINGIDVDSIFNKEEQAEQLLSFDEKAATDNEIALWKQLVNVSGQLKANEEKLINATRHREFLEEQLLERQFITVANKYQVKIDPDLQDSILAKMQENENLDVDSAFKIVAFEKAQEIGKQTAYRNIEDKKKISDNSRRTSGTVIPPKTIRPINPRQAAEQAWEEIESRRST